MRHVAILVLAGPLLAGCGPSEAPIDTAAAARGDRLAENCRPCHSLDSRSPSVGPPLLRVLGRKAGTYPGFAYSDAMKAYGVTWTKDNLVPFLLDPTGVVPGTKMALGPITQQDASDIAEYLRSLNR